MFNFLLFKYFPLKLKDLPLYTEYVLLKFYIQKNQFHLVLKISVTSFLNINNQNTYNIMYYITETPYKLCESIQFYK